MFVHSVYFWLKKDLPLEKRERFKEALKGLSVVETLKHLWVGDPVASERPVVDSSYDVGLVTVFADAAGHDIYQDHPAHRSFLKTFSGCWDQVKVLDFSAQ